MKCWVLKEDYSDYCISEMGNIKAESLDNFYKKLADNEREKESE